mmetsp:Transcript_41704/g.101288  ORF Transcript_41704/g.101288 Transcript_41704/m.101288 type:complete len:226 (-) Transcript_41704:363-1040(-)
MLVFLLLGAWLASLPAGAGRHAGSGVAKASIRFGGGGGSRAGSGGGPADNALSYCSRIFATFLEASALGCPFQAWRPPASRVSSGIFRARKGGAPVCAFTSLRNVCSANAALPLLFFGSSSTSLPCCRVSLSLRASCSFCPLVELKTSTCCSTCVSSFRLSHAAVGSRSARKRASAGRSEMARRTKRPEASAPTRACAEVLPRLRSTSISTSDGSAQPSPCSVSP